MNPSERRRRIKERSRRRRLAQERTQAEYLAAADPLVEEIEEGVADPESQLTYAEAARLAEMTPQALEQARDRYHKRHANRQEQVG